MKRKPLRIIIAGGGTGGHLFPGVAIAGEFSRRDPDTRVLFVGTGRPLEKKVLSKSGFPHRTIPAGGLKGLGPLEVFRTLVKLPLGLLASLGIIEEFKPDLVVGMGGYSSGPVALAAWLAGVKIVLHEQNMVPGITNRLLSFFAERIYISFEKSKKGRFTWKRRFVGNPVREEIIAPKVTYSRKPHKGFTVLILGGSQGAHGVNLAVADSLGVLKNKEMYEFIHQTGAADKDMVEEAYKKNNVRGVVKTFFFDMAALYQKADIIVCRAGATTLAEITAAGKAALFIPYPFAANDHQALNAGQLAEKGAAGMILEKDLDGQRLAGWISSVASDRAKLERMESASGEFGRPDAASAIVNDCYGLI